MGGAAHRAAAQPNTNTNTNNERTALDFFEKVLLCDRGHRTVPLGQPLLLVLLVPPEFLEPLPADALQVVLAQVVELVDLGVKLLLHVLRHLEQALLHDGRRRVHRPTTTRRFDS